MSQFNLLTKKKFAPLFWTQFFGAFNDNFLKNALVIIVTFQINSLLGLPSTQVVILAGAMLILPFFLFSATAGQLADKYEKSKIIRITKLAEIFIMLFSSFALLTQQYELLLFTLFLMGLQSTFFGPVKFSVLPQHLDEKELVGGNALVEAGTFLAILLGTLGGGILISVEGIGPKLVAAILVIVAIMGYLTSKAVPEANATDPHIKVKWNPLTPTWDILKHTRTNRPVFLSILGVSWFWFFGAAMLSLFPHYSKDTLHASEGVVTLFLAVFSIGIGIGSLLCERLSRKRLELGLVPIGSIGISVFTFDLFWVGVPTFVNDYAMGTLSVANFFDHSQGIRIIIDLLLLALVSGLFIVPLNTMIQERSDDKHRSRIIAANNIMNAAFMVLASGLLFLLVQLGMSIPQMFLFLALLNAFVAIYIYTIIPEFLFRFVAWIVANIIYKLKVEGDENVPEQGAAVLICNHVSFVDWLIIAAAVKRPARFVMDHSFASNWIMRRFLKRAKVILIATAKEDPIKLQSAFDQIAFELSDNELVCIFPEGRICKTEHMNIFKPGIEKIIARSPVPVIPMALTGMWGSFFSREGGKAILKMPKRFFSRIHLKIGPAVPAHAVSAVSLQNNVQELGNLIPPLEIKV